MTTTCRIPRISLFYLCFWLASAFCTTGAR